MKNKMSAATSIMVVIAAALILAGCVSTAELARRQCAGFGLSQGDAEYWNCINREEAVVEGNRNRGAAMMVQGGWMLQPRSNVYVLRGY